MKENKKLKICHNKGFHITFDNGWTVSVQFGPGSYSDNYDSMDYSFKESAQSNTAEVWCWNEGDKHYPEDPTNRSTPEEVLEIMNKVSKFVKSSSEEKK